MEPPEEAAEKVAQVEAFPNRGINTITPVAIAA